jgi:hypothetical protein
MLSHAEQIQVLCNKGSNNDITSLNRGEECAECLEETKRHNQKLKFVCTNFSLFHYLSVQVIQCRMWEEMAKPDVRGSDRDGRPGASTKQK